MNSVHNQSLVTTSLVQKLLEFCSVGENLRRNLLTRDYVSIVGAKAPTPSAFTTAEEYAKAYLEYNILRKFDSFPIDIDRGEVATSKFIESEVKCGSWNSTVDALPFVPGVHLVRQQQSIIESAKSIIKHALGKFDLEEFEASCDFSGGSSTRCSRKASTPFHKLNGKPHVTINCRDLAVHYIWCNASWKKYCQDLYGRESDPYSWVQLVPGSKFTTVPKDSTTDRPICVEPDLNMFFQKGIGTMIRRRLRLNKINLNDQSLNQKLALKGSLDGTLATIDLRSASDTISLEVVRMLLPQSWFDMLLTTRSAYVLMNNKYKRLEKISSMGNGFTFELESLIFWALGKACLKSWGLPSTHFSVYGDDIVIDTTVARPLIGVLESLGFETNLTKTFIDGPFRESCGKHYFEGANVTPFFIKKPIETHSDLYHICNSLQIWGWATTASVEKFITHALKPIPPSKRCYIPPSLGSRSGLWCGRDRSIGYSKSRQALKYRYLKDVRDEHSLNGPCAFLTAMLLGEQRGPSEFSRIAKGGTRTVLSYGFTSAWNDVVTA